MLIERPPRFFRALFPGVLFRIPGEKRIFLTFDDGPVPEVTPLVLRILEEYGVKATFFMVGDNVRKHPGLIDEVLAAGHGIGNHTMHHLQGRTCSAAQYMADIAEADALIGSRLFRPPHGLLRGSQLRALKEAGYTVVMQDLVTRDYSHRLDAARVTANVRRFARSGAIIVFHDSLKSLPRLETALRGSLDFLKARNFEFGILPGARTDGATTTI